MTDPTFQKALLLLALGFLMFLVNMKTRPSILKFATYYALLASLAGATALVVLAVLA